MYSVSYIETTDENVVNRFFLLQTLWRCLNQSCRALRVNVRTSYTRRVFVVFEYVYMAAHYQNKRVVFCNEIVKEE